jgi:competence protein ComEA
VNLPEISRRQAIAICALALVALFLAGKLLSAHHPPPATGSKVRLAGSAAKRSAGLYVDVSGAVHRPGLYKLPSGSRVNDALEQAGGATAKADLTLVNLAATVTDGEQVLVPEKATAAPVASAASSTGGPTAPATKIHLNSATVDELDALPGVGPATAQRIIDYRTEHGPFKSVEELDSVSGIGPAKMAELRDLVTP